MPPLPKDSKRQSGSQSVCCLIHKRQLAQCGSSAFQRKVSQFLRGNKELLMDPEMVSPHRKTIASLQVDLNLGRFVLAGSADATLSIYDLSFWGSEGHSRHSRSQQGRFRPVARSLRVPAAMHNADPLAIPTGHSAGITYVQWYPVDTGAFVSCASDGCLLIWDTNRMQPVLRVTPFAESVEDDKSSAAFGCAHWQPRGDHSLVATGSWLDSSVKLVDVRSGASSHQLTGHSRGITTIQWSPSVPVVVASGSKDGTIRLWDIRKSGSQACLTVIRRDWMCEASPAVAYPAYQADYSHLRKFAAAAQKNKKASKKRKVAAGLAPNNFHLVQGHGGGARAHLGHVAALSFLPGGQTLASIGGADGELLLWDLRQGPALMERKFVAPGGMSAAAPKQRRAALCVDADDDTVWVGHQSTLLGFSMEAGGSPKHILRGHLSNITSVDRIYPEMTLLSGSGDGMILSWGKPKGALFTTRRPTLTQDKDSW